MDSGELTVYCRCTPVVDTEFIPGDVDSPVVAIADALAEATGKDPSELPPLHRYVDADALDQLFSGRRGGTASNAVLSFSVEGWNVFVNADGRVRVCDATQPVDPEPVFESATS